jgi:hypothetical protein
MHCWKDTIKIELKIWVCGCGLNSCGSGWDPVGGGLLQNDNEPLSIINPGNLLPS